MDVASLADLLHETAGTYELPKSVPGTRASISALWPGHLS